MKKVPLVLLSCLALGGLGLLVWRMNSATLYPPDVQQFRDKCKQIQVGMNEAEVDAILADYPSSKEEVKREYDRRGYELTRPSTATKSYDQKHNAVERDFFIHVYLDQSGYVVGKSFGEYLR